MALSNNITVTITGNASSLKNSLSVAKESVQNFANTSDNSASKMSTGFAAKMGVIAGVAQSAFSKVTSIVSSSMSAAISRMDTLNNFPKVMSNLGISAEASQQAINTMSDKLTGLPTTLDDAASAVQRFTSKNGNVAQSTDYFLALNNALLAGGQSTDIQSTALEQLSQAYSKGKPDMMEWRSLLTAMPAQLNQVAQAMGYGANNADALGEDLRNGKVSMDDFMQKIVELNTNGANGFQSFADQAKNAIGGLGTQITVAKTSVTRLITAVLNNGDVEKELNNFTTTVNAVAGRIVAGLVASVAQVISVLPNMLSGVVNSVIALTPQLATAVLAFGSNMAIGLLDSINGIATQLPTILSGVISQIIAFFNGDALNNILQAVMNCGMAIVNAIPQLAQVIATQLPSLIQTVITALVAFIPQFLQILIDIVNQLSTALQENLPTIIEAVVSAIQLLINTVVENLPMIIEMVVELINALLTAIVTNLPLIVQAGMQILMALIMGIVDNLPQIITSAVQLVDSLINTIVANLPLIIQAAIQIIIAIVTGLIQHLPEIIQATIQIILALAGALINNIGTIIGAVVQIIFAIVTGLIGAIPQLLEAGVQLIWGLIQGFGQMIGNVGAAIGEIGNNILSAIGGFFGGMAEAGRNLIQGLVNGIGDAAGWVWGKIQEICGSALDGIKAFFGIESPSKVMKQMGKYLMQGFGMGIENNAKVAVSAATQAAVGISDAFASNLVTEPVNLQVASQNGLQTTQNAFNGTSGVYGSTASYITETGATNNTTNSNQTVNFNFSGDIKVEGTGKADTDAVAIVKAIQREFRSQGVQPLISNAGALR